MRRVTLLKRPRCSRPSKVEFVPTSYPPFGCRCGRVALDRTFRRKPTAVSEIGWANRSAVLRRFATSEPETACPKENSFSAKNWDKALIANRAAFCVWRGTVLIPAASAILLYGWGEWRLAWGCYSLQDLRPCMCIRLVILALMLVAAAATVGCSSSKQELPSKEKIQQQ